MNTNAAPNTGWEFLADLGEGRAIQDLLDAVDEVKFAALSTMKKGQVVLKIVLTPKASDGGQLRLVADARISATAPKPSRVGSVWYVDGEQALIKRDPRQPTLPGLVIDLAGRDRGGPFDPVMAGNA